MVVPPKKFVFLDYSKTAGETESAITPSDIIKQKGGRDNVEAILAVIEDRQRNVATYVASDCLDCDNSIHLLVVESLVLAICFFICLTVAIDRVWQPEISFAAVGFSHQRNL